MAIMTEHPLPFKETIMLKKILVALATGAATVFLGNAVYRKVKHS